MPLIAHTRLPAFQRLRDEGFYVVGPDQASTESRDLHIGILNLMPDAALEATERQFMRLLSAGRRPANVYVHLFTVDGVGRQGRAQAHLDQHYASFDDIRRDGLDALLITGANPASPVLRDEGFWQGTVEVVDWAREHVISTLCSCLATHAVVQQYHGEERTKLPEKRWGVYSHRVVDTSHPLVKRVNTRFDAPHSHVYEVTEAQLVQCGIRQLAVSEQAGVHLAVSEDGFRFVYFQGHPEYDINSLLKEYKREVSRFADQTRADYPPFPEHYFTAETEALLSEFRIRLEAGVDRAKTMTEFPETELNTMLENTWTDTGMAMFGIWLDLLHELSSDGRGGGFKPGVDASNPLSLNS
tara:strand:- start:1668 stop:2735 length:1068 start_codon:yes stop_codon:yes gene_type:complete